MSPINPNNFLGVALVLNRSSDGTAFVFHYPQQISPITDAISSASRQQNTVDLEDILLERLSQPSSHDALGGGAAEGDNDPPRLWNHDEHIITDSGSQIVPWEHVAGFPARDLASILTPARPYHKTLFQLSLDPLHCVSYPIHVPENGLWKKSRKASKSKACQSTDEHLATGTGTAGQDSDGIRTRTSDPSQNHDQDQEGVVTRHGVVDAEVEREGDGQGENVKEKEKEKEKEKDGKKHSMTMFNLVFFLNAENFEAKELVDALYVNIIKKANKAYKYSQQHSDFVWKESKRILAAKDKAKEERKPMSVLWKEILRDSSLAASMHDIYEAVSQNKVAALHLETAAGVLTPSLQIPVPFYIADLPQDAGRDRLGLWLTTANAFMSQDALEEPGFLDKNFALLLMDDEKKIISELQADPDPTTASMVEFVRLSKPTISFHQVAQSNVLTLGQVRKYAQHFIYWRRAMAIPPLHARDVYIVSPHCNTAQLPQDSQDWQRLFPVAPPLPNFLGELSQTPRSWKHFCPSKAHRPTYILMLAFLMRRGWVTQLCTFAYVVVWPEIIYEVDYEIDAEELAQARGQASTPTISEVDDSLLGSTHTIDDSQSQDSAQPPEATETAASDTGTGMSTASVSQAAEQARLERIATKAHRQATEKVIAHTRRIAPLSTSHPAINDAAHLKGLAPHIILDAKKATGRESRYLSAIARRFKDPKIRGAWQNFCKYFDGRSALERIALQEEMKRKDAWSQLTSMTEYLLCTRHW